MPFIPSAALLSSGGAYQQLYDNIAGVAIASWDVQSISGSYTHLKAIVTARGDTAAADVAVQLRFNNDSGANYDKQQLSAAGAVASGSETFGATSVEIGRVPAASATANKAGQVEFTLPNYAATTFQKSFNSVSADTTGQSASTIASIVNACLWRNTAAVTRITILPGAGNWIAGSRLTIYGML
jgi:hypothetical protein